MSSLRMLALPAHARLLLTWELTSGHDLRRIRVGVGRFLDGRRDLPAPDDLVQRIGLVATELAGNALRHGSPPITVRLLRDDDCYFLDVSDHDLDQAPETAVAARQIRAGGRGLHIVISLAGQLCWYTTDTTKHVWASFPAPRSSLPGR